MVPTRPQGSIMRMINGVPHVIPFRPVVKKEKDNE